LAASDATAGNDETWSDFNELKKEFAAALVQSLGHKKAMASSRIASLEKHLVERQGEPRQAGETTLDTE